MSEQPSSSSAPLGGSIFLRIVWMAAVPAIYLCLVLDAHEPSWTVGRYDLGIAALVVAGIAARAFDAMDGGTTADGDRSTRSHVIAYAWRLILATAVSWLLVQWIGR